jgi:hypothetical protein
MVQKFTQSVNTATPPLENILGRSAEILSPLPGYAELTATMMNDVMLGDKLLVPSLTKLLRQYLEMFEITSGSIGNDLLLGAKAISAFLGVTQRQVYCWMDKGCIPISQPTKGSYLARKSVLICWLLLMELRRLPSGR